MRSSNKSRSRKNSNMGRRGNTGNTGNIVNRVFDSSGPEGKVRGTPQQIIEKYQALSHDAQMSGDRIGSENFAQHAEHYARLLGNAQREIAERREAQEAQRKETEQAEAAAKAKAKSKEDREQVSQEPSVEVSGNELLSSESDSESNLVQTPENSQPEPAKKPAVRKRRTPAKGAAVEAPAEPGQEPVIN